MIRNYTLEYWVDEGWYVGRIKEIPGIFSQGESIVALEENIQDAFRLMLEENETTIPSAAKTKDIALEIA
jgi:predicted RNase H-like HicB family nuclease